MARRAAEWRDRGNHFKFLRLSALPPCPLCSLWSTLPLSIPRPRQPLPPHPPQPRKKPIRLLNIFRNLRLQLLRPPKLLLLPQFLPEPHLNPFRRKIPRIIQQVRLDRQPRSIERRPHSHIRHAPVTARLPLQHCPRNINAPRRQQLLLRAQIQSRKRKLPPRPCSRHHLARQRKRPPQHPRRTRHVALRDQFPDRRARHNLPIHHHRLMNNHVKSVSHSQFLQKFHVPSLFVPEPEIISHHHRPHLQLPH